jgi:hypothetical protein
MANDIVNSVDGSGTGIQQMGTRVVSVGGAGDSALTNDADLHTIDIANIADKYDDRWDDPRYYAGDTEN